MLLALLVLSATTAVAVSMAALIIKEVKQSSDVDRSQLAFYAAETGIEKSLFMVKQARRDGDLLDSIINDIKDQNNIALENDTSWSTGNSDTNEEYAITLLKKNKTLVMDLYDPSDPYNMNGGFASFGVEALDANPQTDTAWLEISYFPWTIVPGMGLEWEDNKVAKRLRSVTETKPNAPAIFNDLNISKNYRLRVKALFDDLKNVRITAFSNTNPGDCAPAYSCTRPIPNRILIRSTGKLGSNQIGLSASVPWQAPASGIFDYVLFSEQTLDKRT